MAQTPSVPAASPPPTAPSLRDPQRDSLAVRLPPHIRTNLFGLPVPTPQPGAAPTRLPPGLRGVPVFGVAFDFQNRPLEMIREGHRRYGPIFSSNFIGTPVIWLLGPEASEMVLSSNADTFLWRPALMRIVCLLGEGMITSDGDVHDWQRAVVDPALHRQQLASYLDTMIEVTDRVLDTWPVGKEVNIFQEMRRITLQVVARVLLGANLSGTEEALRAWFTAAGAYLDLSPPMNAMRLAIPGTPWAKFVQARAGIDGVLADLIARRRASPGTFGDTLDALVSIRDAEGRPLGDEQIRDLCMTLLVTALNEPANMMTWMQYALATHPEALGKLLDEHRRVVGDRRPTLDHLKQLTYLDMVIKETLRLYPAIWISVRLAVKPFSFGGYDFHAGTFVGLSRYLTHRMPEIFSDPENFVPERFDPERGERHPPFAYLPFGAGKRACPGEGLAVMEGKVIMARLLSRYRLHLRPGYTATPHVGVTLGVRGGLPMVVRPVG
jgi:cytochrome P450